MGIKYKNMKTHEINLEYSIDDLFEFEGYAHFYIVSHPEDEKTKLEYNKIRKEFEDSKIDIVEYIDWIVNAIGIPDEEADSDWHRPE